jgi:hypothetical protein
MTQVLPRSFEVDIVGESYENRHDGTSRQAALAGMSVGDRVYLICEPENPHHGNAVIVVNEDGTGVGYLDRDLADKVSPLMRDEEWLYKSSITGLYKKRGIINAVVEAQVLELGKDDAEIDAMLNVFKDMPFQWAMQRAGRREPGMGRPLKFTSKSSGPDLISIIFVIAVLAGATWFFMANWPW